MFKTLLGLLLVAVLLPAGAALQATAGSDSVTLRSVPCISTKVLSHIPAEFHKEFQKADAYINGKSIEACWLLGNDLVGVMFEDGEVGMIPTSVFKEMGV